MLDILDFILSIFLLFPSNEYISIISSINSFTFLQLKLSKFIITFPFSKSDFKNLNLSSFNNSLSFNNVK